MSQIELRRVSTHNLKGFDLRLAHRKIHVMTGVSGSGKSSLAFDTLYAEGQRRYMESLSSYARQFLEKMPKPDIESATGIPPAVAIQAKNVVSNARSTVGTQTEVNDYLRALFARVGHLHCPDCKGTEVSSYQTDMVLNQLGNWKAERLTVFFPFQLKSNSRLEAEALANDFLKQGFEIFLDEKNKLIPIAAESFLTKKTKEIRIRVDELANAASVRNRSREALELAFQAGQGRLGVTDGKATRWFSKDLQCSSCRRVFKRPTENSFSFNSPLGACPVCQGFGRVIETDWNLVVPDETKTIQEGAIEPWTKASTRWELGQLMDFCKRKKISVKTPWKELEAKHRKWILYGCEGDEFASVTEFFKYLEKKTYKMHIRIFLNRYRGYAVCPACKGARIQPDAQNVFVGGKNFVDIQEIKISALALFFKDLKLSAYEIERAEALLDEISARLSFLSEVGLGYLTLSRMSRTLSGGEVERIHLASSLGASLVDTLYVLDEPSIGLHERDNMMLIGLLRKLRDLGNTVVVVEHDRAMIEAADEVIDLGPMGGEGGGRILYQGPVEGLLMCEESLTGRYLSGRETLSRFASESSTQPANKNKLIKIVGASAHNLQPHFGSAPLAQPHKEIQIKGAFSHNLKNINVNIPLGKLVVLSGVSGSGKSTLLYDVLYNRYQKHRGRAISQEDLGAVKSIRGWDAIEDMVLIDQSPIGRSPRSNPVTYMGVYDEIRKIFSRLPASKAQGFGPGHFSFNVDGGRCNACKGDGEVKVEMHFLADVYVRCEACGGKRFQRDILAITYHGKNIDQVLGMTVLGALSFFSTSPAIVKSLTILENTGLGYLRLGQPTLTLSGGEGQRLKLASELAASQSSKQLYLFDEPTTGLHEHDIRYLIKAFDELLRRGHSVLVIEHHMELIRLADWVIDLGPEGGDAGGEVIYQGDVAGLLKCAPSHTGRCLSQYLKKTKLKIPSFQTS